MDKFSCYYEQANTLWVAYSGGLDSQVLLHKLWSNTKLRPKIKALHINHGIYPEAETWTDHCRQVSAQLAITLHERYVQLALSKGVSVEEAARKARYEIFSEVLERNDCLLMAHHQDDQMETVLLQLIRGSGLAGLAAMPQVTEMASGYCLRPLLTESRQNLLAYAKAYNLAWIEDHSNNNCRFHRNYLRHKIIPLLKQRWPSAAKTISRSAYHLQESLQILQDYLHQLHQGCVGILPNTLDLEKLNQFTDHYRVAILRYWCEQTGVAIPPYKIIMEILKQISSDSENINIDIRWQGVSLRRYRKHLFLLKHKKLVNLINLEIKWDFKTPIAIPGIGRIEMHRDDGITLDMNRLLAETHHVFIRFRKGGERCHPAGRVGSHPLKKCFQEWGVPPWQRSQVPLLYVGEEIIAVVGYCICQSYALKGNGKGFKPLLKAS